MGLKPCLCDNQGYLIHYPSKGVFKCLQCKGFIAEGFVDAPEKPEKVYVPIEMPPKCRDVRQEDIILVGWKYLKVEDLAWANCYIGIIFGREALVMPVYEGSNSNPVYYSARWLQPSSPKKKYHYQVDTKKYYWNWICQSSVVSLADKPIFICEGAADSIRMAEFGCSVGLLGMDYNGSLDELLKDRRLVVCFDADLMGKHGAINLAWNLSRKGFLDTVILELPEGKDPTDLTTEELGGILKSRGI